MANRTSLLPMLEIMGEGGGELNPSNKVFNPTKIYFNPPILCERPITQTPNHCQSSLSGAACTPPEIFLPLLLNK